MEEIDPEFIGIVSSNDIAGGERANGLDRFASGDHHIQAQTRPG